jgi:2-(1,2-epoxy-1,2-dihydrophenyl)acetyl-CoA isomerase
VTGGISALLPALVGLAKARELLLLGEQVAAPDALAMGMIGRIAPPGEHEKAAAELAAVLLSRPPVALQLAKRVLETGLERALATETEHALLSSLSGENTGPRAEFGGA